MFALFPSTVLPWTAPLSEIYRWSSVLQFIKALSMVMLRNANLSGEEPMGLCNVGSCNVNTQLTMVCDLVLRDVHCIKRIFTKSTRYTGLLRITDYLHDVLTAPYDSSEIVNGSELEYLMRHLCKGGGR